MAFQCLFLCISGRANNGLRNAFFSAQEALKLKQERDHAWSLPEELLDHRVTFFFFLVLFTPVSNCPWLNLAEIQSLSIFEGLIIYFVDLCCLSFSTIRTWGSISFYYHVTLRVEKETMENKIQISLFCFSLCIDLLKKYWFIEITCKVNASALYTIDFYYPSCSFPIHHK